MTLDDLGNIGELVSAVAVVISLVYLAVQIRQNTSSVRSAAFQELLNHVAQVNLRITDDPDIAELYLGAGSAPFPAGTADSLRWRGIVTTMLRHWAHEYAQHREGVISAEPVGDAVAWPAYDRVSAGVQRDME